MSDEVYKKCDECGEPARLKELKDGVCFDCTVPCKHCGKRITPDEEFLNDGMCDNCDCSFFDDEDYDDFGLYNDDDEYEPDFIGEDEDE